MEHMRDAQTLIDNLETRGVYLELDTNKESNNWPTLNRESDSIKIIDCRQNLAEKITGNIILKTTGETIPSEKVETGKEEQQEVESIQLDDIQNHNEVDHDAELGTERLTDDNEVDAYKCELGRNPDSGEKIFWDPFETPVLANYGIAITGASGSGKTQLVKLIASQAAMTGLPVMLVDYKNDFWDEDFINAGNFERNDIGSTGLPFNPFELYPDRTTKIRPMYQIHEIVDLFSSAYGHDISHPMKNALKRAMVQAYKISDIEPTGTFEQGDLESKNWPDFSLVWDILMESETSGATLEALESRLGVIKDLNLFPSSEGNVGGFEQLAQKRIVLSMQNIQSNQLRNLLSEILIMRYHAFILREEGLHKFKRFLIFDEAWRISKSIKLGDLVRESRAFGLGLLLSSQSPDEFTNVLLDNMETKIFLKAEQAESMTAIARQLSPTMTSAERQDLIRDISDIRIFQGYIKNNQNNPYSRIDTRPFSHSAWDNLPEGHACFIDKPV